MVYSAINWNLSGGSSFGQVATNLVLHANKVFISFVESFVNIF